MAGEPLPEVPYTLSDMAADAVGLLDHLGIERAHVLGASMGGMIAQTVAIEHPARVASLISVMSMTGELEYGAADAGGHGRADDPAADRTAPASSPRPRAARCGRSRRWFDLARAEEHYGRSFDRRFYPEGAPRQLAAIYASGPRTDTLPTVTAPTLVIHGLDDTLITPERGRAHGRAHPGCQPAHGGRHGPRPAACRCGRC